MHCLLIDYCIIQGNRKSTSFTFYSEQVTLPTPRSIGGKENLERDDTEKASFRMLCRIYYLIMPRKYNRNKSRREPSLKSVVLFQ